MLIGISLILIVVGALAFHFLSPWTFTEIASNWSTIDAALWVTMLVTAIVFVAVNVFMAIAVIKFRYRKDRRAKFEPENKRLEWILIGITSVGIVMLLAPSLFVYSDIISPPDDAMIVEALGQQWSWSFRYPGEDGVFGRTSNQLIELNNPFGIDKDDPHGQDDVLVQNIDNEFHLPVNQPIQMSLRSKDVLHDFYVPNFRVKMDLVPGIVTRTWFTPTVSGTYDLVCAEYCGTGHWAMGGDVVVEGEAEFQTWLASQPTFGSQPDDTELTPVQIGERLVSASGCLGCHSVDGSRLVGPSWQGLYGRQTTLSDGSTVGADDAYIRESILNPNAKVVQGYPQNVMQPYQFDEAQINAIIEYIKSL